MNQTQTEAANLTHLQKNLFHDSQMNYDATLPALISIHNDSPRHTTQKESLVSYSLLLFQFTMVCNGTLRRASGPKNGLLQMIFFLQ